MGQADFRGLSELMVLVPTDPLVLGPAALDGIIVGPVWYAWLGYALLGDARRSAT